MPEALVVGIIRQAIEIAVIVTLPMLLAGLVAGVLVSVFQTVTSIQDNVLAFIPRAAAIFIVFALTFPWMLRVVDGFSRRSSGVCRSSSGDRLLAADPPRACCWCGPGMLVTAAPTFGGACAPAPVRIGLSRAPGASCSSPDRARAGGREPMVGAGADRRARAGDRPRARAFGVGRCIAGAELAGPAPGFQLGFSYAVGRRSAERRPQQHGRGALQQPGAPDLPRDRRRITRSSARWSQSYAALPIGAGHLDGVARAAASPSMLGLVFVLGVQLAVPLVVVLLVVELGARPHRARGARAEPDDRRHPVRLVVGLLVARARWRSRPPSFRRVARPASRSALRDRPRVPLSEQPMAGDQANRPKNRPRGG